MKYIITYNGWTTLEVEASSAAEAEEKFDDDCLSELNDWNIEGIEVAA